MIVKRPFRCHRIDVVFFCKDAQFLRQPKFKNGVVCVASYGIMPLFVPIKADQDQIRFRQNDRKSSVRNHIYNQKLAKYQQEKALISAFQWFSAMLRESVPRRRRPSARGGTGTRRAAAS